MSGGCYSEYWRKHIEPKTFPAQLKANGYRTFYAGKYLNQVCVIHEIGMCDICDSDHLGGGAMDVSCLYVVSTRPNGPMYVIFKQK